MCVCVCVCGGGARAGGVGEREEKGCGEWGVNKADSRSREGGDRVSLKERS